LAGKSLIGEFDLRHDIDIGIISVPFKPGTGLVSYSGTFTILSGVVPEGIYELGFLIKYIDEQGKPTRIVGFLVPSDVIQIVNSHSNDEISESKFTLTTRAEQKVTPYYLAKTISPFLIAIADIQGIIDDIKLRSHREVVINSLMQHTPISVSLDGAAESMKTIRDTIVPWRRNHEETMARLEEQEKLTEIESKKAEILEKRASAAKDRAEAARLNGEVSKQREEVETMKLRNQKLRLEMNREKIQLAIEVLKQLAPNLEETQRIGYIVRLLPAFDVLISSDVNIVTSQTA